MKHGAASMILVRQALGVLFIGSIWGPIARPPTPSAGLWFSYNLNHVNIHLV
jgi:hypothetical protein